MTAGTVPKVLRLIALLLVAGAVILWLVRGANPGWTKTSVQKKTVDDVTGIEGIVYKDRFIPGVDFLAAAAVAAGILAGASFLFRKRPNPNLQQQ